MSDQSAGTRTDEPSWSAYYRQTLGREPRPIFSRGLAAVEAAAVPPGQAIEIGFGDGTETLVLLDRGWNVTAIDPTPDAAEVLRRRVAPDALERLTIVTARAQEVDLPPFDLLYAGYAMPFIDAEAFSGFWAQVRAAIRPGGFIVANFFGTRDTWAGNPEMVFVERESVADLVEGLDVLVFDEIEEDGGSFLGPKHWHTFDIVARAPSPAVR